MIQVQVISAPPLCLHVFVQVCVHAGALPICHDLCVHSCVCSEWAPCQTAGTTLLIFWGVGGVLNKEALSCLLEPAGWKLAAACSPASHSAVVGQPVKKKKEKLAQLFDSFFWKITTSYWNSLLRLLKRKSSCRKVYLHELTCLGLVEFRFIYV